MDQPIKPEHRQIFDYLDGLDGRDGRISKKALDQAVKDHMLDLNRNGADGYEIDALAKQFKLSKGETQVLKLVAQGEHAAVFEAPEKVIDETAIENASDPKEALRLLDLLPPDLAQKLIKQLSPEARLAMARELSRSGGIGHTSVETALYSSLSANGIRALLKSGDRNDIRLLVHFLDSVGPGRRADYMRVFMATPKWSQGPNDTTKREQKPDSPFEDYLKFHVQLELTHQISLYSRDSETRSLALKHSLDLTHMADLQKGFTDEDPTGMNFDKLVRRRMDLEPPPLRDGYGNRQDALAQEYWLRTRQLGDYFTAPASLAGAYAVDGDNRQYYGVLFPDPDASKAHVRMLQEEAAGVLAKDPVGIVNYMKEHPQNLDDRALVAVMKTWMDPPNREALAALADGMGVAADGLRKPPSYATLAPEIKAQWDARRAQSAYALGALYGAAAHAAEESHQRIVHSVKFILKQVLGAIPGVNKIPLTVRNDGLDAIWKDDMRGVPKEHFQELMDEAQREIRRLDGAGQDDLETAYNNGRSIYRKGK